MAMSLLSLAFLASTSSAVQLAYAPPVASAYIYRNDHHSPASLIQLGPQLFGRQEIQPIPAPLPLGPYKLPALEAYDPAPLPLPYIAAKPIIVQDSENENDESPEEYIDEEDGVGHGHGHGIAYEKGGGSDYNEEHHAANGVKGSKGYKSKGYHAKGKSGSYDKGHKEGYYGEEKGQKGLNYDEADAHGKHHEAGGGYKGGDHGQKKHFSKGEDITGYHKVFNKDEFKKDHDFYDVADNNGHYHKHGYAKASHGSEEGAHKKTGHGDAGFNKGGYGKSGFQSKGHIDEDEAGLSAEEGNKSHYEQAAEYEKKGGKGHEKEYVYDDSDDEGDDDYKD